MAPRLDTGVAWVDVEDDFLRARRQHELTRLVSVLKTVVGTVDKARGFDRRFRPTSGRVRHRWEQLDLTERGGAVIPPIEVYRVGGLHFVKDGHHRVSVAMATGQVMIDADVTEVLTRLPATAISR